MHELPVKPLPSTDAGRLLVRLNERHREGIPRYGIAKIRNQMNGKTVVALMLGHDNEKAIFMPFDIRTRLGLEKGEKLNFSIAKVSTVGKAIWYLTTPDPSVHLPAWIAFLSLIVAVIGMVLAINA